MAGAGAGRQQRHEGGGRAEYKLTLLLDNPAAELAPDETVVLLTSPPHHH